MRVIGAFDSDSAHELSSRIKHILLGSLIYVHIWLDFSFEAY